MFDRKDIVKYVKDNFNIDPDFPWESTPNAMVLRHKVNRKWFGLVMEVSKRTVGIEGDGMIDILNVKLEPDMIINLNTQKGFRPAYHMNKNHWITVILDGSVKGDEISNLIELSYEITK